MNNYFPIHQRFRGFLPVVVDVETGGLEPTEHALLELAASYININEKGKFIITETEHYHIGVHPYTRIDPAALAINNIDPEHPLRFAVSELSCLQKLFKNIRQKLKQFQCTRAVLVGHNPTFDLAFIQSAARRSNVRNNPFHRFTTFDTATLGGLVYGETVLAKALEKAEIEFDSNQAHGALYDTTKTAELFCKILNTLPFLPF